MYIILSLLLGLFIVAMWETGTKENLYSSLHHKDVIDIRRLENMNSKHVTNFFIQFARDGVGLNAHNYITLFL